MCVPETETASIKAMGAVSKMLDASEGNDLVQMKDRLLSSKECEVISERKDVSKMHRTRE